LSLFNQLVFLGFTGPRDPFIGALITGLHPSRETTNPQPPFIALLWFIAVGKPPSQLNRKITELILCSTETNPI